MLAFVDESGDSGMKLGKGSSNYLVITMVVFDRIEDAAATEARMAKLRQIFGWKKDFEFHFHKMSRNRKEQFLREIADQAFCYYSIVIDKVKLESDNFKNYPTSLYKCACNYLFSNGKNHLRDAVVVVDGSGSRQFKKEFGSYLRKRANEHIKGEVNLIKKVKVQDSDKNNLIQLADMICGAVGRSFSGKTDARIYRNLVIAKEKHLQVWPR